MVKIGRMLMKEAGFGLNKTLAEILVCPLSKQPLRFCEKTNALVSDTVGVSYQIKDGIPCLVPTDGKIIGSHEVSNRNVAGDSSQVKNDVEESIFDLKSGQWRIKGRPPPPPSLFELIESSSSSSLSDRSSSSVAQKAKGPPPPLHEQDPHPGGSTRMDGRAALLDKDDDHSWCCVCLSRLKENEDRRLLPCLHEFHRECVDRWVITCRKTCPLCRFLLEDEDKTEKRGDIILTEEMILWFSSFHVAGF